MRMIIMDISKKNRSLAKASTTVRKHNRRTAKSHTCALISSEKYPCALRFYDLLLIACEKEPIPLQIPETLLLDPLSLTTAFLYTDKDGVVRAIIGPT